MYSKKLVVFTGPSGVGKATIEKELFKDVSLNLMLAISATTREPRDGEVDGVHYHFISKKEFQKKIKAAEFLEWNEHFSNFYGTLKSEIDRIDSLNKLPLLEIETEGAKNVIKHYDQVDILTIFIAPPSIGDIIDRIHNRGTESEEQLIERVTRVKLEMKEKNLFDYVVYNDVLEHTVDEIAHIIKKECK